MNELVKLRCINSLCKAGFNNELAFTVGGEYKIFSNYYKITGEYIFVLDNFGDKHEISYSSLIYIDVFRASKIPLNKIFDVLNPMNKRVVIFDKISNSDKFKLRYEERVFIV